jgi:2-polyprenyl-6-methoxyphenol hydroxylase-like FAD-dependent oxidoreductase
MLGYLLARAGVEVTVLEKHRDFLRDFRGDTVHPSTLQVMHELGLLEELLARPHTEARELGSIVVGERFQLADFSHLPTKARFVAFMPQWHFLDLLVEKARQFPNFHLRMGCEVLDLVREGAHTVGVSIATQDGPEEVRAELVVGADGRHSMIRESAELEVEDIGAPMDVLWLRLSRREGDPVETLGYLAQGHILVMIERETYWQCAYVIPKGGYSEVEQLGIDLLRRQLVAIAPFLQNRVTELSSLEHVKLLTVKVDRLREWARPGLLCIGDAAHAMSPIGGVGINLAIQDAVATSNLLSSILSKRAPTLAELQRVQKRRERPTRLTQMMQVAIQNHLVQPALEGELPRVPSALRLLNRSLLLRRLPARLMGMGFLPEHVATKAA